MKNSIEADSGLSRSQQFFKSDFLQLEMQTELLRDKLMRAERLISDLEQQETVSQKALSIFIQTLNKLPFESRILMLWGLTKESKSIQPEASNLPNIQDLNSKLQSFCRQINLATGSHFTSPKSKASKQFSSLEKNDLRGCSDKMKSLQNHLHLFKNTRYVCSKCGHKLLFSQETTQNSVMGTSTLSPSEKRLNSAAFVLTKSSKEKPDCSQKFTCNFKKAVAAKEAAECDVTLKSINSDYQLVKRSEDILPDAFPFIKRNLLKQFERARSPLAVGVKPSEAVEKVTTEAIFSASNRKRPKRGENENLLLESNASEFSDIDSGAASKKQAAVKDPSPFSLETPAPVLDNAASGIQNCFNSIKIPPAQTKSFVTKSSVVSNPKTLHNKQDSKNLGTAFGRDEKQLTGHWVFNRNNLSKTSLSDHSESAFYKNGRSLSMTNAIYAFKRESMQIMTPHMPTQLVEQPALKAYAERCSQSQEGNGEKREEPGSHEQKLDSSLESIPESSSMIYSSNPSSRFDFNMKKHSKDDMAVFESFHQSKNKGYKTLLPPEQIRKNFLETICAKFVLPEFNCTNESYLTPFDTKERAVEKDDKLKPKMLMTTSRHLNPQLSHKLLKNSQAAPKRPPINLFHKPRPKEAFNSVQTNSLMTPAFVCKEGNSSKQFYQASFAGEKNRTMLLPNFKKLVPRGGRKEAKSENLENELPRNSEPEPSRILSKFKKELSLITRGAKEVKRAF